MGLVRASELHLTPRRLPCLSASAPARQLPSLASSSVGARGCLGRPPPRPADWPRRAACHALLSQGAETESNRGCPESYGDQKAKQSCRRGSIRCPPMEHRSSKPNPNLNSVRLIAELVGRRFPGGNS
ncbi:ras-related protein Rab-9B isoform X5 [Symphalangus syndactylus]|uniref:ras-related protein Rab-9B isoform X5 n=1 Tax=Symphalangus syndactylus TaxID=9590 RepID=UPI003005FBAE